MISLRAYGLGFSGLGLGASGLELNKTECLGIGFRALQHLKELTIDWLC